MDAELKKCNSSHFHVKCLHCGNPKTPYCIKLLIKTFITAQPLLLRFFFCSVRSSRIECAPSSPFSAFFFIFLFFDARRRSPNSPPHFETLSSHTHTHTQIRLNPQKRHTPQLHRWGKGREGGHLRTHAHTHKRGGREPDEICFQTRTDGGVSRSPEKYARRSGSSEAPFPSLSHAHTYTFFLQLLWTEEGGKRATKKKHDGLFNLPTFAPVNHLVRVGRTVPHSADVSTAFRTRLLGLWKSP